VVQQRVFFVLNDVKAVVSDELSDIELKGVHLKNYTVLHQHWLYVLPGKQPAMLFTLVAIYTVLPVAAAAAAAAAALYCSTTQPYCSP
jgi:hypothetical protein